MPGPTYGFSKKERKRVRRATDRGQSLQRARKDVMVSRPAPAISDYTPGFRRLARASQSQYQRGRQMRDSAGFEIQGPLTDTQKEFALDVAKQTGLSPRVIAAQVLAEMSGDAAAQRDAEGYYNWLNIGHTDSGEISLTRDPGWTNNKQAARMTADFFKGKRFGPGDGIRQIITTAGRPDAEQMAAITGSGWASSGYGGSPDTYGSVSVKPGNPKKAQRGKEIMRSAAQDLEEMGIRVSKGPKQGKGPLKGPYAGSRNLVRQLVGAPVMGDKESGHASGGMHDPSNPDAYAQDIQLGSANPAENEPVYGQALLDRITKNIRRMGGKIPDLKPGMGMVETNVRGYRVQIIPDSVANYHGSGPHLHLGAEYGNDSMGTTVSPTGSSGTFAPTGGTGIFDFSAPITEAERRRRRRVRAIRNTPLPTVASPATSGSPSADLRNLASQYGIAI